MTNKLVKTSELTGAALDWAVAKCVGIPKLEVVWERLQHSYLPSTDWAQGGPIIEREKIATAPDTGLDWWVASIKGGILIDHGPTPLIAAMRCYVASKLGDVVKIPEELL
jgi:hypothetical protein